MKKTIFGISFAAIILGCLLIWYTPKTNKQEELKICIDNIFYHNTGIEVPVEPDESVIEYVEIPVGGGASITAFARVENGLVCQIDSEWYQFAAE